nr:unnamed protein product [Callosobruchus analis]
MPKLKHYDKSKLEDALRDIQSGTESYRTAEKKTLGPSLILSDKEEALLVSWIRDNASKGFPKKGQRRKE